MRKICKEPSCKATPQRSTWEWSVPLSSSLRLRRSDAPQYVKSHAATHRQRIYNMSAFKRRPGKENIVDVTGEFCVVTHVRSLPSAKKFSSGVLQCRVRRAPGAWTTRPRHSRSHGRSRDTRFWVCGSGSSGQPSPFHGKLRPGIQSCSHNSLSLMLGCIGSGYEVFGWLVVCVRGR
jgi:hypothetical protein